MTASTEAMAEGRGTSVPRPSPAPRYGASSGLITKIVLLALVNGLVLWALPTLLDKPDYSLAIASIIVLIVIDYVYLSKHTVPLKYLLPGSLFLAVFALYPVVYTIYNSTTNYGTGNNLSKSQAVDQIEQQSVSSTAGSTRSSSCRSSPKDPRPAHWRSCSPTPTATSSSGRRPASSRSTQLRSSLTGVAKPSRASSP